MFVLATACHYEPPAAGDDDGVDAAVSADGQEPDGPAANDPTACVEWFTWNEQQPNLGQASWGTQLTDIARHIPAQYGDTYWFDEPITAGHETTHGIQAHLRNYEAPPGHVNAFYVLGNKAAFVVEPNMRKSDIKPFIVTALRGPRYNLYLEQQTEWDDTPLYVFDEWTAYVNGAEVGVGQVQAGIYTGEWTDAVMGPLEFTLYAIATAKAAKQKDPTYYATNMQFRCFTAWNIKRAMALYEAGHNMTQFEWDTQEQYATKLRTMPEAEPLREVARELWGADWTQSVLGF
ncbi:MAG TPA: hypothetical protein VFV99_20590 [Kofleriaceae bacterium]|nr:hypothetical protein [Kofleriaceae bacterium]